MVEIFDVRGRHLARLLTAFENTNVLARNLAIVVIRHHDGALRLDAGRRHGVRHFRIVATARLLRCTGAVARGCIGAVEVLRDAHQHDCDEKQQAGAHASYVQAHAVINCTLVAVAKQTGNQKFNMHYTKLCRNFLLFGIVRYTIVAYLLNLHNSLFYNKFSFQFVLQLKKKTSPCL